jgi:hypothetical protein
MSLSERYLNVSERILMSLDVIERSLNLNLILLRRKINFTFESAQKRPKKVK